ncbi:methyl-accepting chemotaxis sensory transducer with Pas/Pac sensor [Humidesulfovibrio mexicanus]|uniref:Methyl-accepting chemotaxis sensory transducer with Pas/Pac sensor n=1 Tax=Humidesulfovibrio mexicanus TaxID=147047 RepID=A0A238YT63_9BACT|nr:methyl-accepting chemotaxis protein [Humidesulfovibrio mexicanus]SNR74315.1 methyl-accepting chemotaxis sensory transducer with Pas/Pac sensor [Humidesulfovibrio mexicanus]
MKAIASKRLSFRYIGCVVLILCLFLSGFGLYLHSNQARKETQSSEESSRAALKSAALALHDWIDGQVKLGTVLSHAPEVVRACRNPADPAATAPAKALLQKVHDAYGFYENIPLAAHVPGGGAITVTVNGEPRSVRDGAFFTDTVNGNTIGKCGAQMRFIQESRQGRDYFISDVYPSLLRGNPIFVIAFPVRDQGEHVGTLILAPRMDKFSDMFVNTSKIGETGHLFFLDDRGMVIAHPDQAMVLKKDLGDHAGYLKRLAAGEDNFVASAGAEADIRYLAQPIAIPEANIQNRWLLCASQSMAEIKSGADRFAKVLAVSGALFLVVLACALYLLTRALVTRPLNTVAEYAKAVEQGDLDATLTLNRSDEIGMLADSLRNMTVHIIGAIREEMGFMQGILGGIRNPFVVVDTELKVRNCSQSMVEVTGLGGDAKDVQGMHVAKLLFGDPARHVILEDVLRDGQPRHNVPFSYTNPKGRDYEMVIDVVVIRDEKGVLLGGITFWNDVTELKARQRAIEAQNRRIEEAAAAAETLSVETDASIRTLTQDIAQSSERTDQQKGHLLETVTAIDELSATVQEIARNAAKTASNAEDTRTQADSGVEVVRESMRAIQALQGVVEAMGTDLEQLSTQADGIDNVMKIINDIADQTNLLALNAAIEAARAGDAGRGFSVVADEVRKLAEKTMAATGEVETAIAAIQGGTRKCVQSIRQVDAEANRSVTSADKTHGALTQIAELARTTSGMVASIATAAEQQSAATEQIARTASGVGAMAEENHLAMRQSESNVRGVETSFKELREIIKAMRGQ